MPKHAGRVDDVRNPQTPRLHCRRTRLRHTELVLQIERLYPCPPRIEVVNHELHHEVLGLVEAGQNEAAGANPEDDDIAIENFFKAQLDVEAFRQIEVRRRYEGSDQLCPRWNVRHSILTLSKAAAHRKINRLLSASSLPGRFFIAATERFRFIFGNVRIEQCSIRLLQNL